MADHDLHDRGLAFDLETIFDRRRALKPTAVVFRDGADAQLARSRAISAVATARR